MTSPMKILQSRDGQFTLDGAFLFLFASMLVVLSISIFGVMLKANTLTGMAADITRYIEIRGMLDSTVYEELAELEESSGLDVEMEVSFSDTIQFGEAFEVTLTYDAEFGIGGIFTADVPLSTTAAGRGERYWKP